MGGTRENFQILWTLIVALAVGVLAVHNLKSDAQNSRPESVAPLTEVISSQR